MAARPVVMRGLALQKAGRWAAAREAYAEALRRDPADPRLGRLHAMAESAAAGPVASVPTP